MFSVGFHGIKSTGQYAGRCPATTLIVVDRQHSLAVVATHRVASRQWFRPFISHATVSRHYTYRRQPAAQPLAVVATPPVSTMQVWSGEPSGRVNGIVRPSVLRDDFPPLHTLRYACQALLGATLARSSTSQRPSRLRVWDRPLYSTHHKDWRNSRHHAVSLQAGLQPAFATSPRDQRHCTPLTAH